MAQDGTESILDVESNVSFATALLTTLDARDRQTADHSIAVASYAAEIAACLGLSSDQQGLAYACGLVHDIGKIGLPAGLLENPGALSLEERREMQKHSEIGERILAKVAAYDEVATVVRHHHERWDGGGYPDGLDGEEIPLLSRVIAVADAYAWMIAPHVTSEPASDGIAKAKLAREAGSKFDPSIVAALDSHVFAPPVALSWG